MRRHALWIGAALALALGAGCGSSEAGRRATVGAGAGAAAGGLIGGGGGALVGGLFGGAMGARRGYELDREDRERAAEVLETTPTDETEEWTNPDTGARYRMTPVETFRSDAGDPCREFMIEGYERGEPAEVRGKACRQEDGSWRIVESAPA
jgi:surface antigen